MAIHRRVFQQNSKPELVQAGHRLTAAALAMIALLLAGILFLVVDVVYDRTWAAAMGIVASVVLAVLLVLVPRRVARS